MLKPSDPQDQSSIDRRLASAIVHWQFAAHEWQQFLDFDKKKRQKEDTRALAVIAVIGAVILAVVLLVGPLQAFAAFLIVAGIIAAGAGAHFLIQRKRYQRMETPRADDVANVYITPEGIWTNGVWFDWGEQTAWRLTTVTAVLAELGIRLPPGAPSYLEFKCRGRAPGRHAVKINKKWRVPVPNGKADEAQAVVRYFDKPSAGRNEFGLPVD